MRVYRGRRRGRIDEGCRRCAASRGPSWPARWMRNHRATRRRPTAQRRPARVFFLHFGPALDAASSGPPWARDQPSRTGGPEARLVEEDVARLEHDAPARGLTVMCGPRRRGQALGHADGHGASVEEPVDEVGGVEAAAAGRSRRRPARGAARCRPRRRPRPSPVVDRDAEEHGRLPLYPTTPSPRATPPGCPAAR